MLDPECISPYCGICQFEYDQGDTILACKNFLSNVVLCSAKISPDQHGRWFDFGTHSSDSCDDLGCASLIACHQHCLALASMTRPQLLFQATQHSFLPSEEVRLSRRQWLLSTLTSALMNSTPSCLPASPRLPFDVWRLIASHLISHYAAANARGLWLPPRRCVFTLSENIRYTRAQFEGLTYITSMSNRTKRHLNCLGRSTKTLYSRENHLGVTNVYLSNKPTVPATPGVWWRIIRDDGLGICGEFDVRMLPTPDPQPKLTMRRASSFALYAVYKLAAIPRSLGVLLRADQCGFIISIRPLHIYHSEWTFSYAMTRKLLVTPCFGMGELRPSTPTMLRRTCRYIHGTL